MTFLLGAKDLYSEALAVSFRESGRVTHPFNFWSSRYIPFFFLSHNSPTEVTVRPSSGWTPILRCLVTSWEWVGVRKPQVPPLQMYFFYNSHINPYLSTWKLFHKLGVWILEEFRGVLDFWLSIFTVSIVFVGQGLLTETSHTRHQAWKTHTNHTNKNQLVRKTNSLHQS